MPEIRQDITTKEWVIIATERSKRPHHFKKKVERDGEQRLDPACPFCRGNEAMSSDELYRRPLVPNVIGADWGVRVVPNKFPALIPEGSLQRQVEGVFFHRLDGVGQHEVVIETPHHNRFMFDMDDIEVCSIIHTYRERYNRLKQDKRFKVILIFKNHGVAAGTSLEHPHSQIIATPVVPAHIRNKYEIATAYFDDNERCIYCDVVQDEINVGTRIILQTDFFVAFHPFASQAPFETLIAPLRQRSLCALLRFHNLLKKGGDIMNQKRTTIACIVIGVVLGLYSEVKAAESAHFSDSSAVAEARVLLEKKEFNRAIVLLDALMKARPRDTEVLALLGTAYLNLGAFDEAQRFFENALDLDPNTPQALHGMGKAFFFQGNFHKAKPFLLKAIAFPPERNQAYKHLGQLSLAEGDLDAARLYYEKLLQLDSTNFDALNDLGVVYQQAGLERQAEKHFKRLIELYPSDKIGYLNIGAFYGSTGRLHDAIVNLNKAAEIDPYDSRPFRYLGVVYLQKKILNEAERQFSIVLALDPLNTDARVGLMAVYQGQAKFDQALRMADEVQMLGIESPQLHLIIANVYFLKGAYDSAITHAGMQIEKEPRDPAGHYMLGVLYQLKGMKEQSERAFAEVRELTNNAPKEHYEFNPETLFKTLGRKK